MLPDLTRATLADIPQIYQAMVDFYAHESLVLDEGVVAALKALIENPDYGQAYVIRSAPAQPPADSTPPAPAQIQIQTQTQPQSDPSGENPPTIGYCILTFGYSLELHGRTALIDELYLPPALRGQGLGTQILQRVIQVCQEQGMRMLELEVRPDNPKARGLYERLGFRKHSRDILRLYP
ncbi:MAG: GNAT family N-acetyltransferase [Prochlorothrix sp.]